MLSYIYYILRYLCFWKLSFFIDTITHVYWGVLTQFFWRCSLVFLSRSARLRVSKTPNYSVRKIESERPSVWGRQSLTDPFMAEGGCGADIMGGMVFDQQNNLEQKYLFFRGIYWGDEKNESTAGYWMYLEISLARQHLVVVWLPSLFSFLSHINSLRRKPNLLMHI